MQHTQTQQLGPPACPGFIPGKINQSFGVVFLLLEITVFVLFVFSFRMEVPEI